MRPAVNALQTRGLPRPGEGQESNIIGRILTLLVAILQSCTSSSAAPFDPCTDFDVQVLVLEKTLTRTN